MKNLFFIMIFIFYFSIILTSEVISEDKNNLMKKKNDIKKTELIADTDVMNINDTCPVMGGAVDKKLYIEKNNRKVYVCCEYCLKTVSKDFDKYYQKAYKPIESGKKEKTIYACPMHPEIISDKPGKCVKCGMKLKLKN